MTLEEKSTSPNSRGYETVDSVTILKSSEDSPLIGCEDGDNSQSQGNEHEPEPNTQLGEDGESEISTSVDVKDGDTIVDFNQIIVRLNQNSRHNKASTVREYGNKFERMFESENLGQYTKRQLAGKKGKEIIINYILDEKKVRMKSRRIQIEMVKAIWTRGLEVPFPCGRWDFGRLPEVGRRNTPNDEDIRPHIEAVEHEEDVYLKVLVLVIICFGIRPSHARLFRWHHIEWRNGAPYSIITTGLEPENKNKVPVVARIPPILAEPLMDLMKAIPNGLPDDPILPYRKPNGEYEQHNAMTIAQFRMQWNRFEKKHLLKHWSPGYFRHWVVTVCRKAEMSPPAKNAMRGHKFKASDMEERYDNPEHSEILEEQARILPYGTIGFAFPRNAELTPAIPPELVDALAKCLNGEMLPTQLQEMVTAYMIRQIKKSEKESNSTMIQQ
jgi:integrase